MAWAAGPGLLPPWVVAHLSPESLAQKKGETSESLLLPHPLGLDASDVARFLLSPLAEAPSRQQPQPLVEIQSHLLPAAGAPMPHPLEAWGLESPAPRVPQPVARLPVARDQVFSAFWRAARPRQRSVTECCLVGNKAETASGKSREPPRILGALLTPTGLAVTSHKVAPRVLSKLWPGLPEPKCHECGEREEVGKEVA